MTSTRPSAREAVLVWIGALFVAVIAPVLLAGPGLLERAFWLDEVLTYWIASDPSLDHSMKALAGGVDTNPPALHLTLRVVGEAFGHTPAVYRLAMMISFGAALAGVFWFARRHVDRLSAAIAACLLIAPANVLWFSFDARFYAPMLACCVWIANLIVSLRERASIWRIVVLALLSAYLCTLHYFGLVALFVMVVGEMLTRFGSMRERLMRCTPTIVGPLALLACFPILLSQRTAMDSAGGTHLSRDTLNALAAAFAELWPPMIFIPIVALMLLALRKSRTRFSEILRDASPLSGLLLYPLVIVAFDLLIQPAILARYLAPIVLATCAIVPLALATLSPRLRLCAVSALALIPTIGLINVRKSVDNPSALSAPGIVRNAALDRTGPLIADWRGIGVPIWIARPELRDHLFLLDDPQLAGFYKDDAHLSAAIPFERHMIDINRDFYSVPPMISRDELVRFDRFTLVTHLSTLEEVGQRFSEWEVRKVGPIHFELTRRTTDVHIQSVDAGLE